MIITLEFIMWSMLNSPDKCNTVWQLLMQGVKSWFCFIIVLFNLGVSIYIIFRFLGINLKF